MDMVVTLFQMEGVYQKFTDFSSWVIQAHNEFFAPDDKYIEVSVSRQSVLGKVLIEKPDGDLTIERILIIHHVFQQMLFILQLLNHSQLCFSRFLGTDHLDLIVARCFSVVCAVFVVISKG